jgi:LPS-assembly lipoprotein
MMTYRPVAAVGAALVLAGCGFHPLYGRMDNGAGVQATFAAIYVPPIDLERAGYELRNDLIDDLQASSRPEGALYDLKIVLTEKNEGIAIQNELVGTVKEVEITRYNYTLVARYQLIDRKTQKPVTKGIESSLSAYDVVASPYATIEAKFKAQKNTAADVAEQLRLRLAVYFRQNQAK